MYGLTKKELSILKKLNTPRKIQNFICTLRINFEKNGETCYSPRTVLRKRSAHCFEGAVFAALALRINGKKPLILDLTTARDDQDHVIAVFKENGHWGCISKTNHPVLRYRDPVYRNIRELVMSFFHEYFDDKGNKNLRGYSMPIDLSRFDKLGWMTSKEDIWYIYNYIYRVKHRKLLSKSQMLSLRKADNIEISSTNVTEWKEH